MDVEAIHIHEDDWGMRTLHPLQSHAEIESDMSAAREASERNRAPDGAGWTDVHVIKPPAYTFAQAGLTFAAADAALAPIMPRVRKFAATIGAAIGREERDPYGSYEDDAHCYGLDAGCFVKLDGGDHVKAIWFEANTDAAGLQTLRRALVAIDALAPSVIADYWLDCSGRVGDDVFMERYFRALAGDE